MIPDGSQVRAPAVVAEPAGTTPPSQSAGPGLGTSVVRYAAIGDSFTEGLGDEMPDGSLRGWADLVAQGLADEAGQSARYANFAVRGRVLEPIVTDQLEAALSLSPAPTLITLNGGGNDMLRPGMSFDRVMSQVEYGLRRALEAQVPLVLVCSPMTSQHMPLQRAIRRRGDALTAACRQLGQELRVPVVDVWSDLEIRRGQYWAADRLHLNAAGHRRVATQVLRTMGCELLPAVSDEADASQGLLDDARYYVNHVGPWVWRRLRGRSSGDGIEPRHPDWVGVEPQAR